jgi:hypothetical protein
VHANSYTCTESYTAASCSAAKAKKLIYYCSKALTTASVPRPQTSHQYRHVTAHISTPSLTWQQPKPSHCPQCCCHTNVAGQQQRLAPTPEASSSSRRMQRCLSRFCYVVCAALLTLPNQHPKQVQQCLNHYTLRAALALRTNNCHIELQRVDFMQCLRRCLPKRAPTCP